MFGFFWFKVNVQKFRFLDKKMFAVEYSLSYPLILSLYFYNLF